MDTINNKIVHKSHPQRVCFIVDRARSQTQKDHAKSGFIQKIAQGGGKFVDADGGGGTFFF